MFLCKHWYYSLVHYGEGGSRYSRSWNCTLKICYPLSTMYVLLHNIWSHDTKIHHGRRRILIINSIIPYFISYIKSLIPYAKYVKIRHRIHRIRKYGGIDNKYSAAAMMDFCVMWSTITKTCCAKLLKKEIRAWLGYDAIIKNIKELVASMSSITRHVAAII